MNADERKVLIDLLKLTEKSLDSGRVGAATMFVRDAIDYVEGKGLYGAISYSETTVKAAQKDAAAIHSMGAKIPGFFRKIDSEFDNFDGDAA